MVAVNTAVVVIHQLVGIIQLLVYHQLVVTHQLCQVTVTHQLVVGNPVLNSPDVLQPRGQRVVVEMQQLIVDIVLASCGGNQGLVLPAAPFSKTAKKKSQ